MTTLKAPMRPLFAVFTLWLSLWSSSAFAVVDCSSGAPQYIDSDGYLYGTYSSVTAVCAGLAGLSGAWTGTVAEGSYCATPGAGGTWYIKPVDLCADSFAASKLTAAKVEDMSALWVAFLGAGVAVICAKAIYSRFKVNYEG